MSNKDLAGFGREVGSFRIRRGGKGSGEKGEIKGSAKLLSKQEGYNKRLG